MDENGAASTIIGPVADQVALNEENQQPNQGDALAERERLISEREQAIELRERKNNIVELLKGKGLSAELADLIRIDSDEKNAETVERLANLINSESGAKITRVDTGLEHGQSTKTEDDSFIKGFKQ